MNTIRFARLRLASVLALGIVNAAISLAQDRFAANLEAASPPGDSAVQEKFAHGPSVVSIDVLRHPLGEKARRLFRRALDAMNSGDLDASREQLLVLLRKYPDSAAYAHSVLGVIYVRTNRFDEAVMSFDVATAALPHDAITHYNFGLSLAIAGHYDRAEQETRRALALEPTNAAAQFLLTVLLHRNER